MMKAKIHSSILPTSDYYNLVDHYQTYQVRKQVYQHYPPHPHPLAFPPFLTIPHYPTSLACH